ncbi:hypothetical protein KC909_04780 [Candidatus Dojkabacteria bacterium]|uniref:Uncharacterized protein n=1 Tax=Candidatus Dojkabacteria bacterium TaxID=2099670 RepID=A0A955L6A8_9BACT|nr:hypothetical protein [Candidatus Dojkabacteria bacterium]
MAEKIISQKVVSQKVIKGQNPILSRFSNLKSAITGTCISPILIILAVALLFYSEGFQRKSEILADLPLENASEVVGESGNHKITGTANITSSIEAPEVGDVLYFSSEVEKYQEVEETEVETITKVVDGQQVEEKVETVKLVEKWQTESSTNGKWATFDIDGIEIVPNGADLEFGYQVSEFWEDSFGDYYEVDRDTTLSPSLGDRRLIVTYVEVDDELIVAGELSDDKMADTGEIFLISNKSDAILLSDLESSENTQYMVLKVFAWLLLTFGFSAILAPVIALADFIPFAGGIAKSIGFFTSAITAFLIVVIASILIKFWWLFFILILLFTAGLVGLLIYLSGKKQKTE